MSAPLPAVPRPAKGSRVATVELHWYVDRERLGERVAERFLEAVERWVPPAMPDRYGEDEPLRGRFAKGGAEGFVVAWTAAEDTLHFEGAEPWLSGSLPADQVERTRRGVVVGRVGDDPSGRTRRRPGTPCLASCSPSSCSPRWIR